MECYKIIGLLQTSCLDEVEFEVGTDADKGKLIARRIVRLPSGTVSFESLGEERLLGKVDMEPLLVRNLDSSPSSMKGKDLRRSIGDFKDLGLGRIIYERQGVGCHVLECFILMKLFYSLLLQLPFKSVQ